MVERMNMSYHSPSTSASRSRRRASSAASSSVSSNGLPQTPVDYYDGLQVGALGDDFSIIKVNGKIPMVEAEEDEVRKESPLPVCDNREFFAFRLSPKKDAHRPFQAGWEIHFLL